MLKFNSEAHRDAFLDLCPTDQLLSDREWTSTVYCLTSDQELRNKTNQHINPEKREISWYPIMYTDFGSGHRAMLLWAFSLWSGNSWEDMDTIDQAYSMDDNLRTIAILALACRWGIDRVTLKEVTP